MNFSFSDTIYGVLSGLPLFLLLKKEGFGGYFFKFFEDILGKNSNTIEDFGGLFFNFFFIQITPYKASEATVV